MTELPHLTRLRGRVKAKLTVFGNFIARIDAEPERKRKLPLWTEKAESLLAEFDEIHGKIEETDDVEIQNVKRHSFESTYYELITAARGLQVSKRALPQHIRQHSYQPPTQPGIGNEQFLFRPAVKLPTIELPKFDGNYELWIPFRDLFESLIASNPNLIRTTIPY